MATLVAWVPESTWPLPLAELIGRPNGRKTARNGPRWRLWKEYATSAKMV